MPVLLDEDQKMQLPRMVKLRQNFEAGCIVDVEQAVRQELSQQKIYSLIEPGQSVAVAVGSRGINNVRQLVKTTIDFLNQRGAHPFIVPAMGSHGGATAEGQQEVLAGYGITEETMGVAVKSSMNTEVIGCTDSGIPVHIDKNA